MKYQPGIRAAGQYQFDVDATRGGILQCRQKLRIGNKVGVGQPNLGFGAAQRRDQRCINQAVGLVGLSAYRAHDLAAFALGAREVVPRRKRRALLLFPSVHEKLLKCTDHRPL